MHFRNTEFGLNPAVFYLEANGIKLIHEFSFFKGNHSFPLFKEYLIQVTGSNSGKLVLGLLPWDNSIAFINGVEILSVPQKQFNLKVISILLTFAQELPTHVSFETLYRLSMGGLNLSPMKDSLWRKSESDKSFLINPTAARNISINPNLIRYHKGVSIEIAPNLVYATAQEMADVKFNNQRFNILWLFQVEQGFGSS
ncbi:hypothetical protein L1887_10045 [Cichorium endivia]|nr:hypothetical protein L1887_10045 [Cichorium endivia]